MGVVTLACIFERIQFRRPDYKSRRADLGLLFNFVRLVREDGKPSVYSRLIGLCRSSRSFPGNILPSVHKSTRGDSQCCCLHDVQTLFCPLVRSPPNNRITNVRYLACIFERTSRLPPVCTDCSVLCLRGGALHILLQGSSS